jgi:hypothetical protein
MAQPEDATYEVEAIVNHRKTNGQVKYLLKWKGFPESENTWELEANLACPSLLKAYWAAKKAPSDPDRVKAVLGCCRGPDGGLMFEIRKGSGEREMVDSSFVRTNCTKLLLVFYESHITPGDVVNKISLD